jgi:hypothetical protein
MKIAIAAAASIILSAAASTATSSAAFAQEAVIQVNQPAVIAQPAIIAEPIVVRTTSFAATYPGQVMYSCPVVPDCRLPNGTLYAGIFTDVSAHGYMFPYGI